MRMSVALDEDLLREARRLSGKATKRAVLDEALNEFIRMKKRERALEHAGKINLDLTLKELRRLRETR